MKSSQLILSAALAAVAALTGCDAGLPPDVARLGYVHRGARFALNLPAGWTAREASGETVLIAQAPAATSTAADADARANIEVAVTPLAPDARLDAVAEAARHALARLADFKLAADESRDLPDGRRAVILTFSHTFNGKPLAQRQMLMIAGGRLFTITATAAAGDFDRLATQFDDSLRSFRAGW